MSGDLPGVLAMIQADTRGVLAWSERILTADDVEAVLH